MTDWPRQCAGVISCFNEAARIAPVVTRLRRVLPHVIVIDDGSTDATGRVAENSGATVLRWPRNRGKGTALRAGWRSARGEGFTWALTLDGDGQHAPGDAPKFFARAEHTGAPLVVGNRMANPAAMPWLRRRVNTWMSRRISALTGVAVPDSQCGFRLARLETLLGLPLTAARFEIESDVLVAFIDAGHRVEFIPIETIYHAGPSKIRPLPDAWRWWRWLRTRRQIEFSHAPTWTQPKSSPAA